MRCFVLSNLGLAWHFQVLIQWFLLGLLFLSQGWAEESTPRKGDSLILLKTVTLPAGKTSVQLSGFSYGETCLIDFSKSSSDTDLDRGSLWDILDIGVKQTVYEQEIPVLGWRRHGWDEAGHGPEWAMQSAVEETKSTYYKKQWSEIALRRITSGETVKIRCHQNYWTDEVTTLSHWERKYRDDDYYTSGFYQNFSTPEEKEMTVEKSDPMPFSRLSEYFDLINQN